MITTQFGQLFADIPASAAYIADPRAVDCVNQIIIDTQMLGTCNGTIFIESAVTGNLSVASARERSDYLGALYWRVLVQQAITNSQTADHTNYWWAEILTAGAFIRLRWAPSGETNTGTLRASLFAKSYG